MPQLQSHTTYQSVCSAITSVLSANRARSAPTSRGSPEGAVKERQEQESKHLSKAKSNGKAPTQSSSSLLEQRDYSVYV